MLPASWAGLFRHQWLVRLPVAPFAPQFPKSGGRPRKELRLILGVLILQQLHDLTDAETVEAVACNLAWHYALGLNLWRVAALPAPARLHEG